MTTIAATVVVALLVVVALARLAGIVAHGVCLGRTYVAGRSARTLYPLATTPACISTR